MPSLMLQIDSKKSACYAGDLALIPGWEVQIFV